jgi:cytochrome b
MTLIRAYHAVLAVLAALAYLSGEMGLIHAWLGYGVAAVIVLRLVAACGVVVGARQLGLQRFYPHFDGLRFDNALSHPAVSRVLIAAIAAATIGAAGTGIAMDRGRAMGLAEIAIVRSAVADDGRDRPPRSLGEKLLKESHELFANLMLLAVGGHVGYLLLFRRPLARFMLFLPPTPPGTRAPR